MDSITQIILGAATGEAVAGKKIGNRAMLWGAVGGTIPDLDVLANFFTDEMTALAFHRGFMHSILFAITAPWLLAWLVNRFYESGLYRKQKFKTAAMVTWVLFYALIAFGINAIPIMLGKGLSPITLVLSLVPLVFIGWQLWTKYYKKDLSLVNMSYNRWVLLFFVSIFTHPILDCFTGYGTQLFAPFSYYRIEWGTIFVADPLYTVPFTLCLFAASRLNKTHPRRALWNWAGILLSSAYLAFTVYHKVVVNDVFTKSLEAQNIPYKRFTTGPTPLNNILWTCMAETDSAYYRGMWGFNDAENRTKDFIKIEKNHEALAAIVPEDRNLQILKWFSNDYYNVITRPDGQLQFNDLRFGIFGEQLNGHKSYVFPFLLDIENGHLEAKHVREIDSATNKDALDTMWRRIKGEVE